MGKVRYIIIILALVVVGLAISIKYLRKEPQYLPPPPKEEEVVAKAEKEEIKETPRVIETERLVPTPSVTPVATPPETKMPITATPRIKPSPALPTVTAEKVKGYINRLERAIKANDVQQIRQIRQELASLGDDVADLLEPYLLDAALSVRVKKELIEVLGDLKSEAAQTILYRSFFTVTSSTVKRMILSTMARSNPGVLNLMLQEVATKDINDPDLASILNTVGQLAGKDDELLNKIYWESSDYSVKLAAAAALGSKMKGELVNWYNREKDDDIKEEIIYTLGEMGSPEVIDDLTAIIARERDSELKASAVEALSDLLYDADEWPADRLVQEQAKILSFCQQMLKNEDDEDLLTEVVSVMADLPTQETKEVLSGVFNDKSMPESVQVTAAQSLTEIYQETPGLFSPGELDSLRSTLKGIAGDPAKGEYDRITAMFSLHNIRNDEVKAFLKELAAEEENPRIKSLAERLAH